MRFENPWWFLALLPAAAAAAMAWFWTHKRRATLVYSRADALFDQISPLRRRALRTAPWAIKLTVLALCVLSLARPQTVQRQAAGLTEGIDILLTLDTSGSMKALDFDPLNRMEAAKNAAKEFIRGRVSDRIGMVVFGGDPLLSCPLTLDYDALLGFLEQVQPDMTRSEGTAIGDGIAAAVNHLKESESKAKVIVLLTDGSSNAGLVTPDLAAQAAASYGIKIYTIGTARRGEALVPVYHPLQGRVLMPIKDELDEDTLLKVAAATGGKYFRAENMSQLSAVYAEIDKLEKHEFEKPEVVSYDDLYAFLLLPAVLLLAGEMALSRTLLLRVP